MNTATAAEQVPGFVIPSGPHAGEDVEDLPSSVLRELRATHGRDTAIYKAAKAELGFRDTYGGHFESDEEE